MTYLLERKNFKRAELAQNLTTPPSTPPLYCTPPSPPHHHQHQHKNHHCHHTTNYHHHHNPIPPPPPPLTTMDKPSVSGVASFDKSMLKRTETVVKQKLPTAADIAEEKK